MNLEVFDMTVAEAISVLKGAEKIRIGWDGFNQELDLDNELMMEAYGQFVVKKIENYFSPNDFVIHVAVRPVRAEKNN
jgi:hypothetical protein